MEPGQMEHIEELVHGEEEKISRDLKKYFLALAAVCLTGWMGWVSLGVIKVYTDGYNLTRLEDSIAKMLDEHKTDMDLIRSQFSSVDARIDALPPKDFRDRVDMMQANMDSINNELKQNASEHTKIIVSMERVEANQQNMMNTLGEIKQQLKTTGEIK